METTERDTLTSEDGETDDGQSTLYGLHPSTEPHYKFFSPLDYCLFVSMLAFSAFIGIYFAFCARKKQNTTIEYLMGGKTMGIIPVSMSLISSYVSGITLLGMPAEMYTYGMQYCTILFGMVAASSACGIIFVPVFHKLQVTTSYEYLEIRFDRKVRLLGSLLFIIGYSLYVPIVIYLPALASSQVTGINLHLITPLVCLVCIFYTSLGGLKAVVWTDALQMTMMFGAVTVVAYIGTNAVGGIKNVWEQNEASGRIELFNFDPRPTTRHTFWNTVFGSMFTWCNYFAIDQAMVQRFLCMPSIKHAQSTVIAFSIGIFIITTISFYVGLLIYTMYHDCDLVTTNEVQASDQLLPYFVMDVAESLPGLPGLFMAGVFSAALSSMSTGLNSMAGVIYEDLIRPFLKVPMTEEQASLLMKIICIIIGVFCVGMVFVVENLGGVTQVSVSLGGVTSGPTMAIFILGMFFPWANAKGALAGGITGLLVMGYIVFGTQAAISNGQIKFIKKPISVDGCLYLLQDTLNTTEAANATVKDSIPPTTEETLVAEEGPLSIFLLSYTLYTVVGLTISLLVGLAASAITGFNDPADVHLDLLTPVIRPLFVRKCKGDDDADKRKETDNCKVNEEAVVFNNILTNANLTRGKEQKMRNAAEN